MELVYLWVEEYKNIKQQGFNFSPRFECDFDGKDLTIAEKLNYSNIFPKKLQITAIIGENGSGKSNILKSILQVSDFTNKFVIVYRENDNYYYYTNITELRTIIQKDGATNGHLSKSIAYMNYEQGKELFERTYKVIETTKKAVIYILIKNIQENKQFAISSFMYLPNRIEIKYKSQKDLQYRFVQDEDSEILDYLREQFISAGENSFHQFLLTKYLSYNGTGSGGIIENEQELISYFKTKGRLENLEDGYKKIIQLDSKNIFDLKEEKNEIEFYISDNYFSYFDFDLIDNKDRKYNSLSTGEQVIFAQLVQMFSFINNNFYLNNKNLLFLFDEPELNLHPQWQKQYIQEIITLLKTTNQEYHLILASHSPFLISDLPKENVIFLDKYKKDEDPNQKEGNCKVLKDGLKKQTFGANIHTLLSDGFFMQDGLMGEFAKGKIEAIKKFYEKVTQFKNNPKKQKKYSCYYEKKKKEFQHIHSIIGEPFLKTIIGNYLDELELLLSNQNDLIDRRIEALKKEQEYLEGLKDA